MKAILPQPAVTQISVSPRRWRLDEELVITSLGWTLVVPKGFVCDGASVPRLAEPLIDPFDLSVSAPFVHDWLYESGGQICASQAGYPTAACTEWFTREEADDFLYDIAAQEGVWWWRRALARKIVRWFGARNWSTPPSRLRAGQTAS